jgi:hypothetical protein
MDAGNVDDQAERRRWALSTKLLKLNGFDARPITAADCQVAEQEPPNLPPDGTAGHRKSFGHYAVDCLGVTSV